MCLRVIFAFVVLDVFKPVGLLNEVFVVVGFGGGCGRLDIVVVWFLSCWWFADSLLFGLLCSVILLYVGWLVCTCCFWVCGFCG